MQLDVYECLKIGGFLVQIGDYNFFSSVLVDQICKEIVNKDIQIVGGIKGFSFKVGVISKYYIVVEYCSIF